MKKLAALMISFLLLLVCNGCVEPKELVDEKDTSRWIVEFVCSEDSDLINNRLKISLEELIQKWKSGKPLTISFQWYDFLEDKVNQDLDFRLDPELRLWYMNNEGKLVDPNTLGNDKYYILMSSRYEITDGERHQATKVLFPGLYEGEYYITINNPDVPVGPYIGEGITVYYFVGNIYE